MVGIRRLQNLTVVNTGMFPPRNLVEHVLCGMYFVDDAVSTSKEEKVPPCMERLQKGYCM